MKSGPAPLNELQSLIATIQQNCRIADAWNAQENPMCIYLMKMRDYYRWTHDLPIHICPPGEQLGKWINQQEQLWEQLAEQPFEDLVINGQQFAPFDVPAINETLKAYELYYSAGYGRGGQAHFHLGEIHPIAALSVENLFITDREFARDMSASPAHTQQQTIVIRKDALRRYIWSKVEEWQWKKPDNAMGKLMSIYPFEQSPESALEQMTNHELHAVLLHEQGEKEAGEILGPQWEEMLTAIQGRREEIICRAARDHLADTLVTLPVLLDEPNWPSIHFYFANLEGFRKLIWPQLHHCYREGRDEQQPDTLIMFLKENGASLWRERCESLLHAFNNTSKNEFSEFTRQLFSL